MQVLRDEITHSRIDWESLRYAASQADVSWLEATMCKAARANEDNSDLLQFGVLTRDIAVATLRETEAEVIVPGLELWE